MITVWPAPAKLNLFLHITGRRSDGYHTLQTLFQFVTLSDTLWIRNRSDGQIRLETPLSEVPNEKNLILKAAQSLRQFCGGRLGASIAVHKRIPLGSGLGGGSSNAATTLAALNQIWKCQLPSETLQQLGVQLGADVPLFLYGHAAIAEGIGEQLLAVQPPEPWYLIVAPKCAVSTAAMFNHPQLPRSTAPRSAEQCLTPPYYNDFEMVVKKCFPEVEAVLNWLLHYAPARLTGSGSALFAEFANREAAQQTLQRVPLEIHQQVKAFFVAQAVNVSPLQQAITDYTPKNHPVSASCG